ncbi:MAG: AzlD domain-containing protein [Deinococcales bacterium]
MGTSAMSHGSIWLFIFVSGLISFGLRFSFLGLLQEGDFPLIIKRLLRYVPVAVLSAFFVPAWLLYQGKFDLSMDNHRLLAGLVGLLISFISKNIVITIMSGMLTLWILGI